MAEPSKQYPEIFAFLLSFQSITYCILILAIICCTIYGARKQHISKWLLGMSISLFILLFIICATYGFFRVNLEFDFQSVRYPSSFCRAMYIASISLYGLSKLLMYSLFLYRLHILSDGTSFEFNKLFLPKIGAAIGIMTFILIPLWMYTVYPSIHYFVVDNISICALDVSKETTSQSLVLLIIGISDNIAALSILFLFIFKLSQIISASNSVDNRSKNNMFSRFSRNHSLTNDLTQLLRKQTVLVSIALLSSCFVFYISNLLSYKWIMLAIPLDCIVNAICTFMTFKWANPFWNCCCVKVLCCNFCQCLPCCNCDKFTLDLALSVSNMNIFNSQFSTDTERMASKDNCKNRISITESDVTESSIQLENVPMTVKLKCESRSIYSVVKEVNNNKENKNDESTSDCVSTGKTCGSENASSKSNGTRFHFGAAFIAPMLTAGAIPKSVNSTADTPLMSDRENNKMLSILIDEDIDTDESEMVNQMMNIESSKARNNDQHLLLGSFVSPSSNSSVRL